MRRRSSSILLGLLGLAAVFAAAGCGDDGPRDGERAGRRLLIVGWDGASFRMLDPLLAAGRLPNLAALAERGLSAGLESTVVPISSAAWAAAVTGRGPGGTGVYSFFEPVPDSYDVRLVGAHSNRATPIWRTLARRGLRSIVWGVPVTFPPEPIPGAMVAGMLSPPDAQFAHPAVLDDRLRARGFVPDIGMWQRNRPMGDPESVREQLQVKQESVLEVLEAEDWSLAWVVYKNLDVISHGRYDGRLDTEVAALCEELDGALGELLAAVGDDTNVLLISDHGFHTYSKAFNVFAWLMQGGWAVPQEGAPPPTGTGGPVAVARAAKHRALLEYLDLDRTRVLATKAEGCYGGLRVNLAGREPQGVVAPGEFEALLAELRLELGRLRTRTGERLVRHVWRASELYPGPHTDLLPDLLFEVDPEHVVFSNRPGTTVVGPLGGTYPDHDRRGVFFAAGPDIVRGAGRLATDLSILDVAPTALTLLGLPAYDSMDGVASVEVLAGATELPRVLEQDDPPDSIETLRWMRADGALDDAQREELMRRMSQLGYTE